MTLVAKRAAPRLPRNHQRFAAMSVNTHKQPEFVCFLDQATFRPVAAKPPHAGWLVTAKVHAKVLLKLCKVLYRSRLLDNIFVLLAGVSK